MPSDARKERPKLIQVVGLGHSGTTLLDAVLGSASGIVGVGEALRTLDQSITPNSGIFRDQREGRFQDTLCSCGATVEECPVWTPLHTALTGAETRSVADSMSRLWTAAKENTPDMQYLLDSTPAGLSYTADLTDQFDVRLVFIVRDIRSWGASQARRRNIALHRAYAKWHKQVPEIQQRLQAKGLPYMRIGYEELALAPQKTLTALCDWLDVPYSDAMLTPGASTGSHITNGNVAFLRGDRTTVIRYDADWLTQPSAGFRAAWLFHKASTINSEMVYGNGFLKRPPKK